MKGLLFTLGFLVLLATEIARVYFIMPFPGSQRFNSIDLAYAIQSNLGVIRLVGLLLIAYPLYYFLVSGSRKVKLTVGILLVFYLAVFYLFNFKFLADKMFYQPQHKVFASLKDNSIGANKLVIGVLLNGEAHAYPIQLIGYHHQVRDVVGGQPIMVTYCTVCRTGRVFSPVVDGKPEEFRLVGMDHFNAMFEDASTRSWWRQVNGEAIAGTRKGKSLAEIPSEQMSLEAWTSRYPNTLILQPDTLFNSEYAALKNYDKGKSRGGLTRADSLSWQPKSWVVGVPIGARSKAYDWRELVKYRALNDTLAQTPVVVVLENDSTSFHTWERVSGRDTLDFVFDKMKQGLIDRNTGSAWNWSGVCIDGKLKGMKLKNLQSYQEFWHSWKTFHPATTQFKMKDASI
jgi:hypothetical protein